MKYQKTMMLMGLVCVVLLCGCEQPQSEPTVDESEINRKVVDTYSDLAIQNAVITQHTLYPYHFVNNSAQLNGLGQRDLSVLIQHFKDNPGQLNVQQGEAGSVLYQSRIQTIQEKLLQGGIPEAKIQISSGMPGGEGIASNAVIEILEADKSAEMGESSEMDVEF